LFSFYTHNLFEKLIVDKLHNTQIFIKVQYTPKIHKQNIKPISLSH